MIRGTIYQKYFLLAGGLIIFFLIMGAVFGRFVSETILPRKDFVPPLHFAYMIDHLDPNNKIEGLKKILSWGDGIWGIDLSLFDLTGQVLYPPQRPMLANWNQLALPQKDYDYIFLEHGELPRPQAPPLLPDKVLVRLAGTPAKFLLIGAPNNDSSQLSELQYLIPVVLIFTLLLSLLVGVGTTIAIVSKQVKKGVVVVDDILSQLQHGNLKVRLPVYRDDEFGQVMKRFNIMADEIEKLVTELQNSERARTKLLQELAHDLRTPIASLKNMLETLEVNNHKLNLDAQRELVILSLKEVDYFGRLVEDLLFLAQVQGNYLSRSWSQVDLGILLKDELEDCLFRSHHQGKPLLVEEKFIGQNFFIAGDAHLLRRLFRNALENAISFTSHRIRVIYEELPEQQIKVVIEDDGRGLSQEGLNSFGQRLATRKMASGPGGRVSVGLGSVVMKAIASVHNGSVTINNIMSTTDQQIIGAAVTIWFQVPKGGTSQLGKTSSEPVASD